ncbi:MAG: DUF2283 domain-containing protein [archaeon]
MKVSYDREIDAMYIALEDAKSGRVKQTIALNDDLIVDFDGNKKIVGIEILAASKNLTKKEFKQVEKAVA